MDTAKMQSCLINSLKFMQLFTMIIKYFIDFYNYYHVYELLLLNTATMTQYIYNMYVTL